MFLPKREKPSCSDRCVTLCNADNYVHRLVASKTDGKLVQFECEGDTCQDEKIDALQLEVSSYFFLDEIRVP